MRNLCVRSLAATAALAGLASTASAQFNLRLLHHSDAESALLNAPGQVDFGGVARFATLVDQLRNTAPDGNALLLSNGDMYLAGSQLLATRQNDTNPFYDAIAHDYINYDAMALGNHEFDFGPAFLARYINNFDNAASPNARLNDAIPSRYFLSSNLNFTNEPALAGLASGPNPPLASSRVVNVGGQDIGIVGAIYQDVEDITTLGGVTTSGVLAAVQNEINTLQGNGVNKIVLISHFQSIAEELALIPQLSGVDVVIAGGGEELLADSDATPRVPGDTRAATVAGLTNQYPLVINNPNDMNRPVALVSVAGKYKYVGQLDLQFDNSGVLQNLSASSGEPVRVDNSITPDPTIQSEVVNPVQAFVNALDTIPVGTQEVNLEGRRTVNVGAGLLQGVRRSETNLGNLTADALRWTVGQQADAQGLTIQNPLVGFQNSGGIRNDNLLGDTDMNPATVEDNVFSVRNAFDVNAFSTNFAFLIQDVSPTELLGLLENSVSRVEFVDGRFAQVSGIEFTYDPSRPAGNRIIDVFLADEYGGEQLIDEGLPISGTSVSLATIDFLAFQNSDGYNFSGVGGVYDPNDRAAWERFGVNYTESLINFIGGTGTFAGISALNGVITAANYPLLPADQVNFFGAVQDGRRIDAVPEPTTLALLGMAGLILARRRK